MGWRCGWWYCAPGGFGEDPATGCPAGWREENLGEDGTMDGCIPCRRTQWLRQDCRRWRPTSTTSRTQLYSSLRPGPLCTYIWWRNGGQGQGWPRGGGNRISWTWRGCGWRLRRRNGWRGGGGGGDGPDGDGLNWWEDTVEDLILGTEHNNPLVYAPVLEHHQPIMSMIGGHGGRLERDI